MFHAESLRAQSTQFKLGGDTVKVVVALPIDEMEHDLRLLLWYFAVSLPVAVGLSEARPVTCCRGACWRRSAP